MAVAARHQGADADRMTNAYSAGGKRVVPRPRLARLPAIASAHLEAATPPRLVDESRMFGLDDLAIHSDLADI